jgi:protocatechuate 3,4-dioxygenase alpha subunit
MRPPTSSQTVGPYWHPHADPAMADLTRFGAEGARIELTGHVIDGDGSPVTDACIEIWQATPASGPEFPGWGRCATDARGAFHFVTLAPDPAAPVIAVVVLARGLLKPLWTRVYLADIADRLLVGLPAARKQTLLARQDGSVWRWDIRLQGPGETVFLDL